MVESNTVISIEDKKHLDAIRAEHPLVLLDFSAEWCGPCKNFAPTFIQYAQENPNVKCCKIDIDKHQDIAVEYNIRSIPSLILIKNKDTIGNNIGALDKEKLQQWVESHL